MEDHADDAGEEQEGDDQHVPEPGAEASVPHCTTLALWAPVPDFTSVTTLALRRRLRLLSSVNLQAVPRIHISQRKRIVGRTFMVDLGRCAASASWGIQFQEIRWGFMVVGCSYEGPLHLWNRRCELVSPNDAVRACDIIRSVNGKGMHARSTSWGWEMPQDIEPGYVMRLEFTHCTEVLLCVCRPLIPPETRARG